jgi:hypothetical protein
MLELYQRREEFNRDGGEIPELNRDEGDPDTVRQDSLEEMKKRFLPHPGFG